MVRRAVIGMLGAAAFGLALAGDIKPRLTPLRLPSISSISIRENGARVPSASDQTEPCETFRLDEDDVGQFLRTAGVVTQHDYLHLLDWSACYAAGDIVFKDGSTAIWGINRFRSGSLTFKDGRVIHLYCPRCRGRMYAPD